MKKILGKIFKYSKLLFYFNKKQGWRKRMSVQSSKDKRRLKNPPKGL